MLHSYLNTLFEQTPKERKGGFGQRPTNLKLMALALLSIMFHLAANLLNSVSASSLIINTIYNPLFSARG